MVKLNTLLKLGKIVAIPISLTVRGSASTVARHLGGTVVRVEDKTDGS